MVKAARESLESKRRGERGYTLVAVLALMTMMALFMMAAAPNIYQQAMRDREQEAIFRGEEVARAIRLYVKANNGQLPSSMDQLLEGVQRGTKRTQILRSFAARDPLSSSGEWQLLGPTDPAMLRFQRAVSLYAGGRLPQTTDPILRKHVAQITSFTNTSASETASEGVEEESASSSKPFIGVASRSRRKSVINYYGIDDHQQWVFTPLFR